VRRRLVPAAILIAMNAAAQQPAPASAQAVVDVVGVMPIDGSGVDAEKYPTNVQILRAGTASAGNALARRGVSISVAEAQSNEMQPDISFRGFVGSPLLGTPQGLAVFIDGVRFNEPFGDTVNWDLLPETAVATAQLIPGPNAAFGLNALGGVIALRTKNGRDDTGQSIRATAGSFRSRGVDVTSGWTRGAQAYFAALSHSEEAGWRDVSPSRLDHLFGSIHMDRETKHERSPAHGGRYVADG